MDRISRLMLALLALLACTLARAEDTTFSNAAGAPQVKDKAFTDYFMMDMTVYYNGNSVTGLGSPFQPTPDGYDDTTNKIAIQTRFRPAYKITPDITIGPVIEWNYFPVMGGDYNFGNIFIRLAHAKVIDQPNLHMMGDLRLYFPNNGDSIAADMIVSGRAYHDAYYTFPKSKLSLGLEEFVRGWSYGSNATGSTPATSNLPIAMWWWAPYVNYDFTPTFAAKVQIDGDFYSVNDSSETKNDPTHLRIGIGWSVTNNIWLAPHIYTPITGSSFSWSATTFNFEGWAQLF
jgi:hypothetical protein